MIKKLLFVIYFSFVSSISCSQEAATPQSDPEIEKIILAMESLGENFEACIDKCASKAESYRVKNFNDTLRIEGVATAYCKVCSKRCFLDYQKVSEIVLQNLEKEN